MIYLSMNKTTIILWIAVIIPMLFLLSVIDAKASDCVSRDTNGRIHRSSKAVRDFKKANPCPATGLTTGPCPGYVVDHIHPLCHCGEDTPRNMQWQKIDDAKNKDQWERAICSL